MNNNFTLLRNRSIIDILIGDTELRSGNKMPYLSGPDICDISNIFGYEMSYDWNGVSRSRWQYMDELIDFMLDQDRMSDLLSYLFDLSQFQNSILNTNPDEIETVHNTIVSEAIEAINAKLVFSRHKLTLINNNYNIYKIDSMNIIDTSPSRVVDIPYVEDLNKRTKDDLLNGHYDSVITKSRTLIEEVLIYILEDRGYENTAKGNINKLYGKVKEKLNIKQSESFDHRVNSMLSGLQKIIDAVTEFRKSSSDSHGVGKNRIAIREHEAELVINSTITFLIYLLEIHENNKY